jgi:hypothetical protein
LTAVGGVEQQAPREAAAKSNATVEELGDIRVCNIAPII